MQVSVPFDSVGLGFGRAWQLTTMPAVSNVQPKRARREPGASPLVQSVIDELRRSTARDRARMAQPGDDSTRTFCSGGIGTSAHGSAGARAKSPSAKPTHPLKARRMRDTAFIISGSEGNRWSAARLSAQRPTAVLRSVAARLGWREQKRYRRDVPQDGEPDGAAPLQLPAPDSTAWQACGNHRYCSVEDILFWEAHGAMDLEALKLLFAERQTIQRQHGRSFLIVDAHELGQVPPENRRYAVEYRSDPPFQGASIIFGASVLARTAVGLISAAARLLGRSDSELSTLYFVADREDACRVVLQRRRALADESQTGKPPG